MVIVLFMLFILTLMMQSKSMFLAMLKKRLTESMVNRGGFPLTSDSCSFITVNMNIDGAIGGLIMIVAMIIKMIAMIIMLITMAGQSGMLMKTLVGGSGPVARDPSV